MSRNIDSQLVRQLLETGDYSVTSLAAAVGVTKQAISYHADKAGWRSPLAVAREQIPWKNLPSKARLATPYQRLVQHLQYVAAGEKFLGEEVLSRRRNCYVNTLRGYSVVVEDDPSIPPSPNRKDGDWRYVPRRESDGDLILRQNEHTALSPEQEVRFQVPERLPEPGQ